ncbi:WD repeat-containing protein 25 isoform X2 [Colius striatus]|uniref:WD repeat-containing protein 25 isoform X2 n=1 Tax=Colius striatus TaxID=57412 RepID=UPI002B1E2B28|nr:WD repeat-containing protein 25 isoform X2 [Colius striatus]
MSSSLVAYDDSDSETETEKAEVPNTSGRQTNHPSPSVSCAQYFAPGSLSTKSTYEMQPAENTDSSGTRTVWEDPPESYAQNNNADLTSYSRRAYSGHAALCMSYKNYEQTSSSSTNSGNGVSQKRMHKDCTTMKGIKPYIPKRLRQENSSVPENKAAHERESSDCGVKLGTSGEQTWGKISELVKPYLGFKYKLTEIPKSLVFCMCKHSGPVNEIQWCPAREQSHLLLSASMDKTIKVWDAVDTGRCLKAYSCHSCAVRAARWSSCGRTILSGGFDSMLHLTDVETGKQIFSSNNEFRISALKFHPTESNVFLCGGFSPEVKAWDTRTSKVLRVYKAAVQQTLDILFLPEGREFLTSTDAVSRDSADRTVIAWDFQSAAKISNQIFHVEGFAVGCEFSPDGTLLVTGSSDGKVFFYNYHTARIIRTLSAHEEACVSAIFHPVLPSLLATCDWTGEIKIWQ